MLIHKDNWVITVALAMKDGAGSFSLENFKRLAKFLVKQRQPEGTPNTQVHHILPRHIFPAVADLNKYPWNGVRLTKSAHKFAHYLSAACYVSDYDLRYTQGERFWYVFNKMMGLTGGVRLFSYPFIRALSHEGEERSYWFSIHDKYRKRLYELWTPTMSRFDYIDAVYEYTENVTDALLEKGEDGIDELTFFITNPEYDCFILNIENQHIARYHSYEDYVKHSFNSKYSKEYIEPKFRKRISFIGRFSNDISIMKEYASEMGFVVGSTMSSTLRLNEYLVLGDISKYKAGSHNSTMIQRAKDADDEYVTVISEEEFYDMI